MNYDALWNFLESRRSVRRFLPDPVADEDLARVLEAARLAPSAGNLQAYRIVVVRDERKRSDLAGAALDQQWIREAPVVLGFVACGEESGRTYGRRGRELYAIQDATIAATYAWLAVESLGLGAVWVGAFETDAVAAALGCEAGETPAALLPIGVPAERPEARDRKTLEELVRTA